ncbi:DUF4411 family protein [Candidatus Tokpelaia sp.]|uniref:DUF4411 family protein n=1 Tax=Candidatus Tokpelaia sp. TaxID=2233777 RepID=UPI001238A83B|nr:DUF4411 family protein [Candidatus Tokpelaia sp.]KAA6404546.1 DUF4411 domain-containing protein [Candidatus Tokpelaia sp.]
MVYLLDANVFIEEKNRHYGLDFCPAFWDWLIKENAAGKVFSLDKVYDELMKGSDELSLWVDAHKSLFLPVSPAAPSVAGRISAWVISRHPSYKPEAKDVFLQGNADYWLIAHAIAEGNFTIVTHEIASPAGSFALKRVKIPDVCQYFSVPCILPFEMLRVGKAQFVLSSSP